MPERNSQTPKPSPPSCSLQKFQEPPLIWRGSSCGLAISSQRWQNCLSRNADAGTDTRPQQLWIWRLMARGLSMLGVSVVQRVKSPGDSNAGMRQSSTQFSDLNPTVYRLFHAMNLKRNHSQQFAPFSFHRTVPAAW